MVRLPATRRQIRGGHRARAMPMGAMGLHRVALLAALALAQGRGRSRRSLARGGTTAGPSTVEECVPTDENEGDDGSQGEQCQVLDGDEVSWCTDTVKNPFLADQPGFFCDWCLCKACDVCTNLASPSPPPATAEVCVPKDGTDDYGGDCAKSAKKLKVTKRGRQCLLSCRKYYPKLKLKKKDQCVMP